MSGPKIEIKVLVSTADDYKTYSCDYPFKGDHWLFEIKAADFAEAQARLKALAWAQVNGEVVYSLQGATPRFVARMYSRYLTWRRR